MILPVMRHTKRHPLPSNLLYQSDHGPNQMHMQRAQRNPALLRCCPMINCNRAVQRKLQNRHGHLVLSFFLLQWKQQPTLTRASSQARLATQTKKVRNRQERTAVARESVFPPQSQGTAHVPYPQPLNLQWKLLWMNCTNVQIQSLYLSRMNSTSVWIKYPCKPMSATKC